KDKNNQSGARDETDESSRGRQEDEELADKKRNEHEEREEEEGQGKMGKKARRNGPGRRSTAKRERRSVIKSNQIKMRTAREKEREKRSGRGSESMAKSQRVLVKVTKSTKLAGDGRSGWAMAGRNAHPFRLQSCVSPRPSFLFSQGVGSTGEMR
ncbi:hypothetical protein ASPBRDRAFT_116786, partial [Aspergillus brasiliensis CBS 101740]